MFREDLAQVKVDRDTPALELAEERAVLVAELDDGPDEIVVSPHHATAHIERYPDGLDRTIYVAVADDVAKRDALVKRRGDLHHLAEHVAEDPVEDFEVLKDLCLALDLE